MKHYYIRVNDDTIGPLSLEELNKKNISDDTWIWREGLEDWVQVKQLGDEVFISSAKVGVNLSSSNFLSRNVVLIVLVLLFLLVFITGIVYRSEEQAENIYSSEQVSEPLTAKNTDGEAYDGAQEQLHVKGGEVKEEKLKKNYFLSDDESSIYFFDGVERYWWFKQNEKFLTLQDQCDFSDVYRKNKSFYSQSWNVVDIPDNVEELNKLYKKEGKLYERTSSKQQKITSSLMSKSVFYNLLQKNEYAKLKSTKEQIRNQFDFILYSNGYDGDTVKLYLSYSVYDPVDSDWRFADRKYRFARNDVKFFEWLENSIADDYKRYIKEKKKTEVINFTNNTSTTPVGIFIRMSLLGDFDLSKF